MQVTLLVVKAGKAAKGSQSIHSECAAEDLPFLTKLLLEALRASPQNCMDVARQHVAASGLSWTACYGAVTHLSIANNSHLISLVDRCILAPNSRSTLVRHT